MNKEKFWEAYNNRQFESLYSVFNTGLDVEFNLEEEATQASWSDDYELLYFLWKVGAKGETPFVQEIFDKFAKGETFTALIAEKQEKEQREKANAAADLTNYETVNDIPIGEIELSLHEDAAYFLHIQIKPYIYDDHLIKPDGLHFGPLSLHPDFATNTKQFYKHNAFDESIYIDYVHTPVELKSLEFKKINASEVGLIAELNFNFQFVGNGENEVRILEKIIKI